jgi:hypothetical protein
MKKNKLFLSENILFSLAGHLAIIAAMTATMHFAVRRGFIVAPDRVEIMEIDLSRVEIAKETKLFNTNAPVASKSESDGKNDNKKQQQDIGESKSIDKTSVIDNKKKVDNEPNAPMKYMIVRVNRETASLNRTMTISVVDALRVALTRCWAIDRNHSGIEDLRVVARLTMNQNGMARDLWFEGGARAETDPAFAYVVETIRGAIAACQPFKMLPASVYEDWKNIILTFYPSSAKIM